MNLTAEEINSLYEFIDKVVGTLNRRFIALFNRLKGLKESDDIIEAVNAVYTELDKITREYLLLIARKVYKLIDDDDDIIEDIITLVWIEQALRDYDPITKYVYIHEVDRKRTRLIEALIASEDKAKEVENAKRLWSRQATQYADNIAEMAAFEAYKKNGVKEVIWQTEQDSKVCNICRDRDGVRYKLENVPIKPHYRCRCWLRAV